MSGRFSASSSSSSCSDDGQGQEESNPREETVTGTQLSFCSFSSLARPNDVNTATGTTRQAAVRLCCNSKGQPIRVRQIRVLGTSAESRTAAANKKPISASSKSKQQQLSRKDDNETSAKSRAAEASKFPLLLQRQENNNTSKRKKIVGRPIAPPFSRNDDNTSVAIKTTATTAGISSGNFIIVRNTTAAGERACTRWRKQNRHCDSGNSNKHDDRPIGTTTPKIQSQSATKRSRKSLSSSSSSSPSAWNESLGPEPSQGQEQQPTMTTKPPQQHTRFKRHHPAPHLARSNDPSRTSVQPRVTQPRPPQKHNHSGKSNATHKAGPNIRSSFHNDKDDSIHLLDSDNDNNDDDDNDVVMVGTSTATTTAGIGNYGDNSSDINDDDVDEELEVPYTQHLGLPTDQPSGLPSNNDVKREPLRPGDVIMYTHPLYVAGSEAGLRVALVLKTHPGPSLPSQRRQQKRRHPSLDGDDDDEDYYGDGGNPLTLDNGEVLPADTQVRRCKEYRQGRLRHHRGIFRPIEDFVLRHAELTPKQIEALSEYRTLQDKIGEIWDSIHAEVELAPQRVREHQERQEEEAVRQHLECDGDSDGSDSDRSVQETSMPQKRKSLAKKRIFLESDSSSDSSTMSNSAERTANLRKLLASVVADSSCLTKCKSSRSTSPDDNTDVGTNRRSSSDRLDTNKETTIALSTRLSSLEQGFEQRGCSMTSEQDEDQPTLSLFTKHNSKLRTEKRRSSSSSSNPTPLRRESMSPQPKSPTPQSRASSTKATADPSCSTSNAFPGQNSPQHLELTEGTAPQILRNISGLGNVESGLISRHSERPRLKKDHDVDLDDTTDNISMGDDDDSLPPSSGLGSEERGHHLDASKAGKFTKMTVRTPRLCPSSPKPAKSSSSSWIGGRATRARDDLFDYSSDDDRSTPVVPFPVSTEMPPEGIKSKSESEGRVTHHGKIARRKERTKPVSDRTQPRSTFPSVFRSKGVEESVLEFADVDSSDTDDDDGDDSQFLKLPPRRTGDHSSASSICTSSQDSSLVRSLSPSTFTRRVPIKKHSSRRTQQATPHRMMATIPSAGSGRMQLSFRKVPRSTDYF